MTINELLDQAKTRANLTSDYALAKAMGIDRAVVSAWRKGRKHPSNEEAIQLATLSGLEEMQVIAQIEYETAKNEHKKEFWKHFIESRGLTACLTMTALACTIILTPEPAEASVLHLVNYDVNFSHHNDKENIHYAYLQKQNRPYGILLLRAICLKLGACLFPESATNAASALR